MKKVLVIHPIHEVGIELLSSRSDILLRITHDDSPEALLASMRDADAITVRHTRITRPLIEAAERLSILSRHGVGCDNIEVDALTRRGIPITITGEANSTSVAEHALFLMLSIARCGRQADAAVRAGQFNRRTELPMFELEGKRLLVLGFGRIGRKTAALARAFGMEISVHDPAVPADQIAALGYTPVALHAGLREADIVTLHLPMSEGNVGLLDERAFEVMKRGAVLINTARGELIDESALHRALSSGRLGAAGLDVFQTEPPPPESSLLRLDNVAFTPHCSALTRESAERMALATAQNILDRFDGKLREENVFNPDYSAYAPQ